LNKHANAHTAPFPFLAGVKLSFASNSRQEFPMIKLFRATFSIVLSTGTQKPGALQRLGVLSGRPSGRADARRWLLRLLALPLLLTAAIGHAATVDFNGSTVQGCTLSEKTYNCTPQPTPQPNFDAIGIAAGYSVIGNLLGASAVLTGDAKLTGNLDVDGVVTMGPGAFITGNVIAGGTVTLGSRATIQGDLKAGTTVTMDEYATITGNVKAGTTVTSAAYGRVGGNVTAGETVTMAAASTVGGCGWVHCWGRDGNYRDAGCERIN
jgi:cytoskeletal protein CcmA (bactofilin family)